MTVIAWDGKTLAVDRLAVAGGMMLEQTKLFDLGDGEWAAITGQISKGLALVDWYKAGHIVKDWPECQKGDDYSVLVIASKDGCKSFYDVPHSVPTQSEFEAWGSGAEYAMGAMAHGANAVEAVIATSEICNTCGLGFNAINVEHSCSK